MLKVCRFSALRAGAAAVLATQHESAKAIAKCVATTLWSGGPLPPVRVQRQRVAAEIVETYLKGRTGLLKMTTDGIATALQCFREVSVKAPDFAEGLAYPPFDPIRSHPCFAELVRRVGFPSGATV